MKLDTSIKDQLKTVFQAITTPIQLVIASSHHPKQAELVSMLEDLASTSRVTAEPPSWLGLWTAMIHMNQESLVGASH